MFVFGVGKCVHRYCHDSCSVNAQCLVENHATLSCEQEAETKAYTVLVYVFIETNRIWGESYRGRLKLYIY